MLILLIIALAAVWGIILQAMMSLQDSEELNGDELKFFPILDESGFAHKDRKNEKAKHFSK